MEFAGGSLDPGRPVQRRGDNGRPVDPFASDGDGRLHRLLTVTDHRLRCGLPAGAAVHRPRLAALLSVRSGAEHGLARFPSAAEGRLHRLLTVAVPRPRVPVAPGLLPMCGRRLRALVTVRLGRARRLSGLVLAPRPIQASCIGAHLYRPGSLPMVKYTHVLCRRTRLECDVVGDGQCFVTL